MPTSAIVLRALSDTFIPPLSSGGTMAALGLSEAHPWQRRTSMARTAAIGQKRRRFGFMAGHKLAPSLGVVNACRVPFGLA